MSLDTFLETALDVSMLALVWALYLVRQRRLMQGLGRPRPFHRVRRLFRRTRRHGGMVQNARVA
jgi:hypothetical protein